MSACLAAARPVKSNPLSNSAQNLRAALRRLGQNSKWSSKPPPTADREAARRTATATATPSWENVSSTRTSAPPNRQVRQRDQDRSFRLRAKALLDHLHTTIRDLSGAPKASPASVAHADAAVAKALAHFEAEMKALRVMLKSKDVLVDPDNAWKSASRIKAPYNAAIRLCLQTKKFEHAFKLLNQMKKDGVFPSATTYNILINGLTRALILQTHSDSSPRNTHDLHQTKEAQRVREVYQDLEKLWKQAFPRYFTRTGAPRSKEALVVDQDNFHALTEQARRNLVSQQASIHEAREFPKVLTNAIGAYANFLRYLDAKDELDKLFDCLFPTTVLDSMAKGLAPDASPQDKLELANRKLSESLPLGDKTTFSVFLMAVNESLGPNRLAMVTRIWSRLATLMDLERHELVSASSFVDKKRRPDSANIEPDALRFVPDDQFMTDLFKRLKILPDADPAPELRLGLSVLAKVYGLDLEASADSIVRDPQISSPVEAFGPEHYLRKDLTAIDAPGAPVAELRDSTVASCVFRLLLNAGAWEVYVALFNYLWARHHAEHVNAGRQSDSVTAILSDTAVFGSTLRPAFAMRVLWYLAKLGDPMGARVMLDAMKRAAEGASAQRFETQQVGANRRARRSAKLDEPLPDGTPSAAEWKPADIGYARALRAILTAVIKGPQGLTAIHLKGDTAKSTSTDSSEAANLGKYDGWSEAKSLFAEWCDLRDAGSRSSNTRRSRPDVLSRVHADTMRSLLLHIARTCATQRQGEQATEVAREALRVLEERVGLERLIDEAKQLERGVRPLTDSDSDSEPAGVRFTSYTLGFLSKVLAIALDTSEQSFAPKADVELWKRVKKIIPAAASASDETDARTASQQRPRGEMRGRHAGGNRLLLSKDDYLELEAEVDEDDEAYELAEENVGRHGGSYRMQRRSRHVEQEIERWVRGSSL